MSRKAIALDTLRFWIAKFLTGGPDDNEALSVDAIIESGELTRAEILQLFEEELDQRLRS